MLSDTPSFPLRLFAACLLLLAATAPVHAAPTQAPPTLRLYAIDCGHLAFKDMGLFSDTGEYDGKPGEMAVPCFLIRHPKGDLIWDTGLGDGLASQPDTIYKPLGITATVRTTLVAQLAELGLAPQDIDYLALSHLHADHAGNANLFTRAIWLLSRRELAWATTEPSPPGVAPALFSGYRQARVTWLDLDHDVFGDGSVRILRAPGHTAGHAVLMLQLAHAGTVILSGDLFHTRENRRDRRVPPVNDSRAETLASFDRIETLLANRHARLVIQHAPEDFAALPAFPAYLD
ncbi:N-acyl homoserine lactonase family protein [Luteimonas aquatica]|uniref:N-acyl homoserine lactonase family protein n=1 Tax=Luteimonas aquatica TaxID=450364 RepID=UPI001F572353|nr:N-acyl homoserine lactonase family protein [Luteimonas aquatica]